MCDMSHEILDHLVAFKWRLTPVQRAIAIEYIGNLEPLEGGYVSTLLEFLDEKEDIVVREAACIALLNLFPKATFSDRNKIHDYINGCEDYGHGYTKNNPVALNNLLKTLSDAVNDIKEPVWQIGV